MVPKWEPCSKFRATRAKVTKGSLSAPLPRAGKLLTQREQEAPGDLSGPAEIGGRAERGRENGSDTDDPLANLKRTPVGGHLDRRRDDHEHPDRPGEPGGKAGEDRRGRSDAGATQGWRQGMSRATATLRSPSRARTRVGPGPAATPPAGRMPRRRARKSRAGRERRRRRRRRHSRRRPPPGRPASQVRPGRTSPAPPAGEEAQRTGAEAGVAVGGDPLVPGRVPAEQAGTAGAACARRPFEAGRAEPRGTEGDEHDRPRDEEREHRRPQCRHGDLPLRPGGAVADRAAAHDGA